MAKNYKTSFRYGDSEKKAVDRGSKIWDELDGNTSEIICKILVDWDRIHDTVGGKAAMMNRRMEIHEKIMMLIAEKVGVDIKQVESLLAEICEMGRVINDKRGGGNE